MTEFEDKKILQEIKKCNLFKGFSKPENAFYESTLYGIISENSKSVSKNIRDIVDNISYMFFFVLAPDSEDKPYSAFDGNRLKEDVCRWLYDNIEQITDNVYILSRIFDVLWVGKKLKENNINSARKAVFLYRKCIDDSLKHEDYIPASFYAQRLYNLARKLKDSDARLCLFNSFEEYAKVPLNQKNEPFLRTILQKILNMDVDEKVRKGIIESFEKEIRKLSFDELIISFDSKILFSFFRREKENKRIADLSLFIADYYEQLAQKDESPYRQIYLLEQAIKFLKEVDENPFKEKISYFYKRIQDIQPITLRSMVEIETPIPEEAINIIKKQYDDAFELISGESFEKDLLQLSNRIALPHRETIESYKPASVLSQLIPSYLVDSRGRPIKKYEEGFSFEKQEYRRIHYQMSVFDVCISPMTTALNEKYNFSYTDLLPYTHRSMFIENGQEEIYARGLYYFLKGMYIEAASLIVPVIENSLRKMLKDTKSTIYMNKDGTYNEKIDIKYLLDECRDNHLIDDVLHYNLSEILCENNVRNNIAHGFIPSYLYSSIDVIVLLAIVFKIVMFSTFLKCYGKYME